MSEMNFCFKCREKAQRLFPSLYTLSFFHCHHPKPEEKPKCVCYTDWILWIPKSEVGRVSETASFCPKCGRALGYKGYPNYID